MDIEVNNNKQRALFKNGKFYHTFTPSTTNQTVKLYHMGCVGDTRLNRIQLEQGTEPTGFVEPKATTNTISGIFKNLRDLDVKMTDPDSDLWTRIKKTARGTVEEYHTNTIKNEIVKTAEGIVERQTKVINSNVDEKVNGAKNEFNTRVTTLTSQSKRYADEVADVLSKKIDGVTTNISTVSRTVDNINSNITSLESNVLKKNEISITSNGVTLGSGKVIDGRTITSLITTQPENIKAITDRMIISPANENLVLPEYRDRAKSNSRDTWLTPKINVDDISIGDEYVFKGGIFPEIGTTTPHNINFILEYKSKQYGTNWITSRIISANGYSNERNYTLRVNVGITDIEYIRLGIQQETSQNYKALNIYNAQIYKKKSAELIVDGTIEGKHIKSSTIETGHLKAGSVTANIIASDAIQSKHLKVDDAMIEKLVTNKAFVNQLWANKAFVQNLNAIKVSTVDLVSYRGRIGNFNLGKHPDGDGQWITGADNFSVGMSDGSWNRTALWVNWGNTWERPGRGAWYVTGDGEMVCYNSAYFYQSTQFNKDIVCTANITYNYTEDGVDKTGMWVYSPIYKKMYKKGDKWLYLEGIRTGEDWITIDSLASDRRIKTNIVESNLSAVEIINKFKTYSFTRDYKNQVKDIQLGIMAQDVKEYMYDAFIENPDGIYSYEPFEMIPYLIKGIQELSTQNKELQNRISKLEEEING